MSHVPRPEKIDGYEHPSEHNYISRHGVYKTFTEGQKRQEDSGTITSGKQYAKINDLPEDRCPKCDQIAIRTCQCGYSDKMCNNGHIWYTDREGIAKLGNPH